MIAKSDWELLGIEPTVDIRQIKKAYARKLKLYSPEDDPVQFQILRQVYERALQYVEYADYSRFTEDTFNTEDTFDTEDTACEDENFYNPYDEEREAAESGYAKTECVENTLREPEIRELTNPMPALEKFKK